MNISQTRKKQKGSAVTEGVFAVCFLMFVFLAMLQIFQWCYRQMVSEYASFYGAKALALGYSGNNCSKAVRVAAMAISGRDISAADRRADAGAPDAGRLISRQAEAYMRLGDSSGIDYEYWHPLHSSGGRLDMEFKPYRDYVSCGLKLDHAPLLIPAMAKILSLSPDNRNAPDASSRNRMYNYSADYLDGK